MTAIFVNHNSYQQFRDHSLFMTGSGLAKKRVGHEVFLTEKGGLPKNIGSKGGGGVQLFIIVVL